MGPILTFISEQKGKSKKNNIQFNKIDKKKTNMFFLYKLIKTRTSRKNLYA